MKPPNVKNVATDRKIAPGELAVAEEAEVDQRLGDAQLDDDECHEQDRREHERDDDAGRAEAVGRRLDQRVGERRQEPGHEQLPGDVDAPRDRAARAGHDAQDDHQCDEACEGVGDEHRAPAQPLGECPADDRPEPGADTRGDAPDPDCAGALARFGIEVGDDREARRRKRGAADRLQHAEHDQPRPAWRQRAGERPDREQGIAGAEHALAPEAIGQESGAQQQARADEVVGVDHPRGLVRADAEIALQRRQRHDHDRHVERHEEDAEREREERERPVLGSGPRGAPHLAAP